MKTTQEGDVEDPVLSITFIFHAAAYPTPHQEHTDAFSQKNTYAHGAMDPSSLPQAVTGSEPASAAGPPLRVIPSYQQFLPLMSKKDEFKQEQVQQKCW